MSEGKSVSVFIPEIAYLCGSQNADRISDVMVYVYSKELKPGSVYDRNDVDRASPENRSRFIWAMLRDDPSVDLGAVEHCRKLMEIIERIDYLDEHGEKEQESIINNLFFEVQKEQINFPKIAEVMSAEEAVSSWWNV